jgi:hypothetical protein
VSTEPLRLSVGGRFLRTDRADATDVEIRFVAVGEWATRAEIEHSGGWSTLLPHYRAVLTPSSRGR